MYENLMDEAVSPENYGKALKAVIANDGAPGIDGMRTEELSGHLLKHWPKIHAKLMAGSYTPSPVRRKEIDKQGGGTRMLGIPTVLPVHPTDAFAGDDTDLGATIQRAQLRISAGAERARCGTSRARIRPRRERLGGRYGHQ